MFRAAGRGIKRFINRVWLQVKQSTVGPLVSLYKVGQAVWTPRDYKDLAEEGYQKNVIAFSAISEVAQSAASVEFILFSGKGDDRKEIKDHPLLTLLQRPNPMQGQAAFFTAVYSYYQISGNQYMEAVRVGLNGAGEPRELYTHRPDRTQVIPGAWGFPQGYKYEVNGQSKTWPVEPVTGMSPFLLHVRSFHPLNDWYGMSAMEAAAFSIDIHNETGEWNKSLLDNGARPSGALIYKAGDGEPSMMGDKEYDRLKTQMDEQFTGKGNAGRPFLFEGNLSFQEMQLSPKDMDYINSKNTSARDIALAFGVPPMLLGIQGDSTFNNQKEARLALWEQTILPLVELFVDELNNWLVPMYNDNLTLGINEDIINALAPRRAIIWETIGKADFLTDNEKREALGFEPIEGGEVLFKPLGVAPITFLSEPAEPIDEGDKSMKFLNLSNSAERFREWRIQDRLMRNHERGLEGAIKAILLAQGRKSAEAFLSDGPEGLELSLVNHAKDIENALKANYNATIESFGTRVIKGLKEHGPAEFKNAETKDIEDFFGSLQFRWITAHIGRKVTNIAKHTRTTIFNAIIAGQAEEESLTDIAKRIEAETSGVVAGHRARTIAATETHAAAIAGNDIGVQATGLDLKREWLSAGDSEVRESHMQADGQLRPMGEPFDVGGAKLLRPGDPSAPADETINCRCTVIYQSEEV